jgi:hypothetical protein
MQPGTVVGQCAADKRHKVIDQADCQDDGANDSQDNETAHRSSCGRVIADSLYTGGVPRRKAVHPAPAEPHGPTVCGQEPRYAVNRRAGRGEALLPAAPMSHGSGLYNFAYVGQGTRCRVVRHCCGRPSPSFTAVARVVDRPATGS